MRSAYARYEASGTAEAVDIVVLGVLRDFSPRRADLAQTAVLPDAARLVGDLGFDSLTITEMVFFLEDLFRVRITNAEIVRVHTVGELRSFVREKLSATKR